MRRTDGWDVCHPSQADSPSAHRRFTGNQAPNTLGDRVAAVQPDGGVASAAGCRAVDVEDAPHNLVE